MTLPVDVSRESLKASDEFSARGQNCLCWREAVSSVFLHWSHDLDALKTVSDRGGGRPDSPGEASVYRPLEGEVAYLAVDYRTFLDAGSLPLAPPAGNSTGIRIEGAEISDAGVASTRASFLIVVGFEAPRCDFAEFDDWYITEHGPLLVRAKDWLRVRHYRVLEPNALNWTRLSIHELASLEVLEAPERKVARDAPKRLALAERAWLANSKRSIYERLRPTLN